MYSCPTKLQVASQMQCPHLILKEGTKVCRRMLEEGLDGEVNEFDIKHYCKDNPTCCYYFRASSRTSNLKMQLREVVE